MSDSSDYSESDYSESDYSDSAPDQDYGEYFNKYDVNDEDYGYFSDYKKTVHCEIPDRFNCDCLSNNNPERRCYKMATKLNNVPDGELTSRMINNLLIATNQNTSKKSHVRYYHNYGKCIYGPNKQFIKDAIVNAIRRSDPSKVYFNPKFAIRYDYCLQYFEEYFTAFYERSGKIKLQAVKYILKHQYKSSLSCKILKYSECDLDVLHHLICSIRNFSTYDVGSIINNILENNPDMVLTQQTKELCCKHYPIGDRIEEKLEDIPYSKNCLTNMLACTVCSAKNYNKKKYNTELPNYLKKLSDILDCRFPITQKHFQSIFTPYLSGMIMAKDMALAKAELLFKYGYKPDIKDIRHAVRHRTPIMNLDRFGLDVSKDPELLGLFQKQNMVPPDEYNLQFDKDLYDLENACIHRISAAKLKKLVKKTVPTTKCMEMYTRDKGTIAALRVLVGAGGKMTYNCVMNQYRATGTNQSFGFVLEEYNKVWKEEQKELETLRNRVKELEEKYEPKEPEKEPVDEEPEEECADALEEEPSKKEVVGETVEETVEIGPKIITITPKTTVTAKRKKNKPTELVIECLQADKKKTVSFYDIRKLITNKIKENGWINSDNKKLFKFPGEVSEKLGLDKDGYIQISDLDNVATLFI